jgi:bifunctional non-homologous end joining protein LigD
MITHPEKVLFPDDGITKGDLAAYYEALSPVILPHLRGRPITMERYPTGIGQKGFWQKDVSKGFPDWLKRVEVPKKGGVVHHPVVTDRRSLLWITNQNTITQHIWASRIPDLRYPDLCVFDLDPSTDDQLTVRAAAMALRDLLQELTLPSWIKTTGSKGFHIVVPLDGTTTTGQVARFANAVGQVLVSRAPDRLTSARPIEAGGSTSIPDEMATARHLLRRIPSARDAALRCPRPARGQRSSAARSPPGASPCATCANGSRRSATSGVICAGAGDR